MGAVDIDAEVDLSGFTSVERELLRLGVMEWERSDDGRERVAQLLGFENRSTLTKSASGASSDW
jgi:hypothetical protein